MGVFGWRRSLRLGREESKSEDVKEMGVCGWRDSPVMVMGRANREESAV